MRINHNISAMTSQNSLAKVQGKSDKAMQKLSTGLRINTAADDAAGMAISNKLRTQVKGLKQASRNSLDGISLVQTADGALAEVQSMLQRMRELAIQSANDTMQAEDRAAIQSEINQLLVEIDDTSKKTEFNKIKLLNGDCSRATASSNSNAVTCTYTSALVNPGTITYTLVKAGTPAALVSDITSFDDASLAEGLYAGKLMINGEKVVIAPEDDKIAIANKLKDVCDRAGIQVLVTGGDSASWTDWLNGGSNTSLLFVTKDTGSSQKIAIVSDNTMLINALGFTEEYNDSDRGSDAIITNVRYDGKDVLPSANGNEITISADAGQVIRININAVIETDIEGGEYRIPMNAASAYITVSLGAAETVAEIAENRTAIAASRASASKTAADNAASKSNIANDAVVTANTAINTAKTAVDTAKAAASGTNKEAAKDAAIAARTAALNALNLANTAASAANAANSAASAALASAASTLAAANAAKLAADASSRVGDDAADDAAAKADIALADAQKAYDDAVDANNKAADAASKVSDFQSKANDLFNSANTSVTTATAADNAEKAKVAAATAATASTNIFNTKSIEASDAYDAYIAAKSASDADLSDLALATATANALTAYNNATDAKNNAEFYKNQADNDLTIATTNANNTATAAIAAANAASSIAPGAVSASSTALPVVNAYKTAASTVTNSAATTAVSTSEAAISAAIAADSGYLNGPAIGDLVLKLLNFGPLVLHVGPNENMTLNIEIPSITSEGLRIKNINLRSREGAEMAIPMIDEALTRVNDIRSRFGAYQNRLEYTISNLDRTNENATSSLSRIEDTDMAESMTEYTQQNVLSQAGVSILAQANQRPQQILQLLQ